MIKRTLLLLSCLLVCSPATAHSAISPEHYLQLRAASLEILINGHIQGSGWFAASHGLAITSAHLVRGSGTIEVISPASGRLAARLIATDPGHDLALLQVARPAGLFPALELASTLPLPGESLFVFGSPLNRHALLIPGMVAAEHSRYEWNERNQCYTESLLVAAMTPEGFSGAPWINEAGLVVGVQSGMVVTKGGLAGIAVVAPAESVCNLLRSKRSPLTAALGGVLAEAWEGGDMSKKAAHHGVQILQVVPGGSLEMAGVQAGEIIYSIDHLPALYRDDLLRAVASRTVGEPILLGIGSSFTKQREVSVQLGGCPDFPSFFNPAPNP